MRRDASGKFTSNWNSEPKRRVSVTLTNTAWRLLEEEAKKYGISRSEVIERTARSFVTAKHQLIATQAAERKVAAILESITDAFVAFDRNWRCTYVNQAAAKILHSTPTELLGKHVWNDIFPERVGKIAYQQLHHAVAEQVPVSWEEWDQPLQCWLEMNAYPSDDGVALYFRDVTQRKQLEAQLQDQKQQFKMLAENAPDIIARFDSQFRHLYISPSIEQSTGLPATAFIGKTNAELGMPDALRLYWEQGLEQVFVTSQEQQIEFQFPTPKGNRWYQSRLVPEFAADGSIASVLSITRDIEDYKQAERALRQSEERLRFALDSAGMVAWEWTPTTNEGSRSHNAGQLLGVRSNTITEAISEFCNLVHPDDRNTVLTLLEQAITQRSFYSAEFRIMKPDGTVRWMFDQGRIICDDTGDVVCMSGVIQDITERKQAEAEREHLLEREKAAREQAETANRVKDEFLAVLSHELRTPLNPILGWTKLLRNRQFDVTTADRALETIERNAKLQAQLIEDLLDVSRILQGKVGLNACPVDLDTIIEAACETVRLSAEAKRIQIQTVLDSEVGQVNGDANRLQQIVWNLLSNAIKFTPLGGHVNVRLEKMGGYAQIQVSDTGQGISSDFLPHVFEYFRQADSTTTRRFGGLGLGLAIVRHLVELHGGTVSATSPGRGMGATFTVKLPLHQHRVIGKWGIEEPCLPVTASSHPPLMGLQILIVDDEADMRDLIRFILEEQGATVRVAASAIEALQQVTESVPDVLISDIGMPDMDGYALMRQIRAILSQPGKSQPGKSQPEKMIPAIALTAYAGETNQHQALAAGFQIHLAKPADSEALIRAICQLCGTSMYGNPIGSNPS